LNSHYAPTTWPTVMAGLVPATYPTVMAGPVPRLSGQILVDVAHGVDSSGF
jgi:hypothetical protein